MKITRGEGGGIILSREANKAYLSNGGKETAFE